MKNNEAGQNRNVLKYLVLVFIWSTLLNYPWEMLQMPLYKDMSFMDPVSWLICFRASLGDGILILGIWSTGYLVFRRADWILKPGPATISVCLISGALLAVIIEVLALRVGRWQYSVYMPLLPGIGVGLSPLLQLILLPWLSMRLAGRVFFSSTPPGVNPQ